MPDVVQLVLNNIAVATLLAGLAWCAGRSSRHSFVAHLLWVGVFVKLITPPLAEISIPVPEAWYPRSIITVLPAVSVPDPSAEETPARRPSRRADVGRQDPMPVSRKDESFKPAWPHILVGIWLSGFCAFLIRDTRRFLKLQALVRNEGEVDEEASAFVDQLMIRQRNAPDADRQIGPAVIRLPIRISPMLFGLGRSTVIVCPEILWQTFTADERSAFLAHEAAHYCRRDHWVRWIEWLASTLYWWFPLLHIARRQLEKHEEACCDSWAVQQLRSSPRSYAEALLKAVEFMSVRDGAIPRLASGMQATRNLEHRLRLVMQSGHERAHPLQTWIAVCTVAICVMLHPRLKPTAAASRPVSATVTTTVGKLNPEISARNPQIRNPQQSVLPEEPQGFWNRMPPSQWASFSLPFRSAKITADTTRGLRIHTPGNDDLVFARDELTGLVGLPSAGRVIIGSGDGSLRIWDLAVAKPVSLIGQHPVGVVSLDHHQRCGLVSADANGVVVRWNIQSGEQLASWHSQSDIQAVRLSSDGLQTAVLTGRWDESASQTLNILEADSLAPERTELLHLPAAVVVPSGRGEWLLIDWAGNVRTSGSERVIARIPKVHVSALVFAGSQSLQQENGEFPVLSPSTNLTDKPQ